MSAVSTDFGAFFRAATGNDPYAYQRALAELSNPPAVLAVPTGAGKTQALIVSWLFRRLAHKTGPRRLVYALPMRSLVEQTVEVACHIRERLQLDSEQLSIHKLMGGAEPAELGDWRLWPERDQILVGTIDMLLSRALNRGYADSRFAWPVAFGLLSNDCRWVFDEVQLMGSARATSAQLDGLRNALGTALACETLWASATIDPRVLQTVDRPVLGSTMSLPDEDRGGALSGRLNARKTLERLDVVQQAGSDLATSIAKTALDRHVAGTRTLIVLNTVDLAQAAYRALGRFDGSAAIETVLLHSRFRPPERQTNMGRALAEPPSAGTIVVATQVVEAGVDVSARTLVTETAPFSSIIQRLGRCNRADEYPESSVVWLDRGPVSDDATGRKLTAPYHPSDIEAARSVLLERESTSLSPAALEEIEVHESLDEPATLRRRDLLDLFDTTPDLSGMDIDIAPFIREDDDRSVGILFRDLPADTPTHIPKEQEPGAAYDELVQVPIATLGKRTCWMVDHLDGGWTRRATREVAPGSTVLLRAAEGGYDAEIGWDNKLSAAVQPIPHENLEEVDSFGSDVLTETAPPEELLPHLTKVSSEATRLADALGLSTWSEVLRCAGALHDLGKAHPVFQATLRSAIYGDAFEDKDDRLWAKSGRRGGTHERPYFRHELASALAIRRLDGHLELPERDLIAYLTASHHGKVRLSIRPAPDERRPENADGEARFALGIVDGDLLPEVKTPIGTVPALALDLAPMDLGDERSWTDAALRLRDDPSLGPFRLGFLEALLRVADWRASRA
jgi:CRISPR-associated endonuclease/helicase Cas3